MESGSNMDRDYCFGINLRVFLQVEGHICVIFIVGLYKQILDTCITYEDKFELKNVPVAFA